MEAVAMMTNDHDLRPGRLSVLGEAECWDLLPTQPVGRIAWSGPDGVSIVPVNFAVDDGAILIRTTSYSQLAREGAVRDVAFEVDAIDGEHHTGWSVVAHGHCERERQVPTSPTPWVTGPRYLGLRLAVTSITGRRIEPVDPSH